MPRTYPGGSSVNRLSYNADWENIYNMMHPRRGKFLLINNIEFDSSLDLGNRRGTEVDAKNLVITFRNLNFEICQRDNLTAFEMLQAVIDVAALDHRNSDCFAMAILSHGDDGLVYGTDMPIPIQKLVEPLRGNRCKSLVGKPKLFFVQACRGNEFDEGVDMPDGIDEDDDPSDRLAEKSFRIPLEADFLYAYSTPPGHFAFRNSVKGAWFIQAIANVFREFGTRLEINQLMTRVNRSVAYDFESQSKQKAHSRKKQVSSVVSMLTKELYFPAKQ